MSWPTAKLSTVAPAVPLEGELPDQEAYWLLNLDQVESQSGRVLTKLHAPKEEMGTSVHAFGDEHILYSKLRPNLNKVVVPDEVGYCTSELVPLLPNPKKLDRKYLAYYLRSEDFVSWAVGKTAGAKMPRLNMKLFGQSEIPLPPLATQKHIARVLEQADQLRKQAQQMESELKQLAQSLFLEMFGDPVRNTKDWNRKPLSDVAKLARGRFSARPRNDPQFYGGQYPFIQTGTVVAADTYITTHEQTLNDKGLAVSKIFPSGTIAITIAANIGATAILTYPTCFPDSVVGITAGAELGVEFLEYQLRFFKQQLDSGATETAQKNINLQVLEPLMMIVPPWREQEEFVGAYKLIHEQLTLIRITKLAAENGFNSLMQRAFNGELTAPERKAA